MGNKGRSQNSWVVEVGRSSMCGSGLRDRFKVGVEIGVVGREFVGNIGGSWVTKVGHGIRGK